MPRYVAPTAFVVGVLAIILGAVLQTAGVAAVIYLTVIIAGIVVGLVGVGIWLVEAFQQRRPTTA